MHKYCYFSFYIWKLLAPCGSYSGIWLGLEENHAFMITVYSDFDRIPWFTPSPRFCIMAVIIGGLCRHSALQKSQNFRSMWNLQFCRSSSKAWVNHIHVLVHLTILLAYLQQFATLGISAWVMQSCCMTSLWKHSVEATAYKQAVRVDTDVQPVTFWFSNKERFPHLFDLAIRYLSVAGNSVRAKCSVITEHLMYHSGRASLILTWLCN